MKSVRPIIQVALRWLDVHEYQSKEWGLFYNYQLLHFFVCGIWQELAVRYILLCQSETVCYLQSNLIKIPKNIYDHIAKF